MGSTQGRFANRIEDSRFMMDGDIHNLVETPNANGHCLHGGEHGFSRRVWDTVDVKSDGVTFQLISEHGDQGFPGKLEISAKYQLSDANALSIEFVASCDRKTIINLANHAYFNLNNDGSDITNHNLQINADQYAPLKENHIPDGRLLDVADTVFDFRRPARLAEKLGSSDPDLELWGGFDHNFVLSESQGGTRLAAVLSSPQSGLTLKLHTTQAGLQLYTGQGLGAPFRPFEGVALEAQSFPNAPNIPAFPGTELSPGEEYRQLTVYEFSIES
jgi:aldose 1-epimerase